MLDKLKNLNLDRMEIDETVSLLAFGESLRTTYDNLSLDVPSWLNTSVKALYGDIKNRRKEFLEREKKKAELELESLKTVAEKREALKAKLAKLTKALAD